MLRVRRTGITEVVGILQKRKLISYGYGEIKIIDRAGLERSACECYRTMKEEFNDLLKRRSSTTALASSRRLHRSSGRGE